MQEAVLNADVTQETIQQTICVPSYTATVRPSTNYTNGVKFKLMREQGVPAAAVTTLKSNTEFCLRSASIRATPPT